MRGWERVVAAVAVGLSFSRSALAQEEAPAPPPDAVESLRAEAAALAPLVETESAKAFLRATEALPLPEPRTLYRPADRSAAYTESEAAAFPESERAALTPREFDARFYYYTGYGSPLVYARPLDLVAHLWESGAAASDAAPGSTPTAFAGKRILDFGYGSVGHLRLLASLGAECVGVEVEPVFRALYSLPGDQGEIAGFDGSPAGHVELLHGRWPAEESIRAGVGEGFDLVISKNVLKRGYIHPAREVDERFLVHLGVSDEEFLRAAHAALKPDGLFLIYNISPAQNPEDQPYLPHADGQSPFTREQLEHAGFEVLEFDRVDTEAVLGFWKALGYDGGKSEEQTRRELFAWYTLARRPK
ncbi:MAG TPA: hypothetical protein VFF69_06505 [Phycisphaerales bacterium]|nr:hypothetical protein [Phycisphaerales bacterium]